MLPFLKSKQSGTVMLAHTKPEGGIEDEGMEGEPNHALLAAAEDLIRAVHSKDAMAVSEALEAAHEICSMGYYGKEHPENVGE